MFRWCHAHFRRILRIPVISGSSCGVPAISVSSSSVYAFLCVSFIWNRRRIWLHAVLEEVLINSTVLASIKLRFLNRQIVKQFSCSYKTTKIMFCAMLILKTISIAFRQSIRWIILLEFKNMAHSYRFCFGAFGGSDFLFWLMIRGGCYKRVQYRNFIRLADYDKNSIKVGNHSGIYYHVL